MDIIEELTAIRDAPAHGNASYATLFLKLVGVVQEMAKRIEALEQRELGHIKRVGKPLLDNDQG